MKKQVLTLAGMHRSGTSLIMSWLEKLGVEIFDKMEANTGNRLGHFEDRAFCKLQAQALFDRNRETKGWLIDQAEALMFSPHELEQAIALYQDRNTRSDQWGWKDPRTVVFLEQWKKIIPDLKVILLYRPYQEVVDSLLRRSREAEHPMLQLHLDQAIDNWIYYNQLLVEYYRSHTSDTLLWSLDQVLTSPSSVFQQLQQRFAFDLKYVTIQQVYRADQLRQLPEFPISHDRHQRCEALWVQLEEHRLE